MTGLVQPLPAARRKPPALFTVVLLALGGLSFVAPLVALSLRASPGRGLANQAWRAFGSAGWGTSFMVLLLFVLAPALAIAGVVRARGKRVPGGLLLAAALGPAAIGYLSALSGQRMMLGAVSGASVDPAQRARIVAEGLYELTGNVTMGGTASACLAWTVIAGIALGLIASGPGDDLGGGRWTALGIGATAALTSVAVRVVLHVPFTGLDALVMGGALGAGLLASACAPQLSAMSKADEDTAGHALRSVVVMACGAALGALLLDRASVAVIERGPFEFASGESVAFAERLRVLTELAQGMRQEPIAVAVDVVGAFACFVPALIATSGAKQKGSLWGGLALVVAVTVAGVAFTLSTRTTVAVDGLAQRYPRFEPPGVTLPAVEGLPVRAPDVPRSLIVRKDGSVDTAGLGTDWLEYTKKYTSGDPAIISDGSVTFDAWWRAAAAAPCREEWCSVAMIVVPVTRADLAAAGPFTGLVGTDLVELWADIPGAPKPNAPGHADASPTRDKQAVMREAAQVGMAGLFVVRKGPRLAVLDDGDDARLFLVTSDATPTRVAGSGDLLHVPLGPTKAAADERARTFATWSRAHPAVKELLLAPAKTADVTRVATLLARLQSFVLAPTPAHRWPAPASVVLTEDRAAIEAAASP